MGSSAEDFKSKRNIINRVVVNAGVTIPLIPTSFMDIIDTNRKTESLSRYAFEVEKYGVKENILDEYVPYLLNPEFLHRVFFQDYEAVRLQQNVHAIATVLYRDLNMAWSIVFLNDLIKHPADLTRELLVREGVIAFNEKGLNALRELKKFKEINEQNAGSGDKEALFTLDQQ